MNLEDSYILNPAYYLRNDVHRAILGTYDFPNVPESIYDKGSLYILHPLQAQLLSFFNGEKTLQESIHLISDFFDIEPKEIYNIVKNYIENKDCTCIYHSGTTYYLPKQVIISKRDYKLPRRYKPQEFEIDTIDTKSIRLYKPIKIIIETNLNCYTDCEYCYADRNNPNSKKLIPISRLQEVIREAYKLDIPSIEVNGGEVLLHPNASTILEELHKNGYHPLISTKLPLSAKKLEQLSTLQFKHIQISIDTLDEIELCRRLNVKKGYLNKIIETMNELDRRGFLWQVNIVLTKTNISISEHLQPLLVHLSKYKNIQSIKIAPLGYPMYKTDGTFSKLKPSYEDLKKTQEFVISYKRKSIVPLIFEMPKCTNDYRYTNIDEFGHRNRCTANQSGMVILPNGDVTICEELYWNKNFLIGNILKNSIEDIWNSDKATSLFNISQQTIDTKSNCYTCNIFNQCRSNKGVCWKMVVMAYGHEHWDYPDPSCPKSNIFYNNFSY